MKPFSLLIKPVCGDCNLRCAYCFYLGRRSLYAETTQHRMTDPVLERLIQSYLATGPGPYTFTWQGGEPSLMGLDFFKRVATLQKRYVRTGQVVTNGLQTNGVLLDDAFARHLSENHYLVGVSLDGPADVHDAYRKYADGRGSHADVLAGLACLARHAADFNILTLVTQANVRRPAEIYDYLCSRGYLFQQYIECVEFDRTGKLQPFAISGEAWGDFLCGIFDAWFKHDTRRVSIRLFDSIVLKLVDGVNSCCTMGTDCRDYLVVEHNGDIYPCDFFVQKELRLGNVMDDAWKDVQEHALYRDFGERKRQADAACEGCVCLRFCAGDCPKNRGPGVPTDFSRRSALCAGWKQFYAHALPGLEKLAADIRRERQEAASVRDRLDFGIPRPVERAAPAGRNDPCPCGSGKKFKKCCGAASGGLERRDF